MPPASSLHCSHFLLLFLLSSLLPALLISSIKLNQRIHMTIKAIHYVDPTKQGFRVILRDEFLRNHMTPNLLPTLYLTAIPLRQPEEQPMTRVFYPDSVAEERQISIDGLREHSWHFLCIEWENFNRHNETTGTDCRLFRTLDSLGKGADSTVSGLEATDFSSQMLQFRIRADIESPMRLTANLEGGKAPGPPAQVFQLSGGPSVELELIFPFLRQQTDYGQLCLLEEPLVQAYTALGRLVTGISIRNCHFSNLTTTDYDLSILESAEASPYIRNGATNSQSDILLAMFIALLATALCRRDNVYR